MFYHAVIHKFFVHSKGWIILPIEADTEEEAHRVAKARVHDIEKSSTCKKAEYHLIGIADKDVIYLERKLTWKERIFGWAKVSIAPTKKTVTEVCPKCKGETWNIDCVCHGSGYLIKDIEE